MQSVLLAALLLVLGLSLLTARAVRQGERHLEASDRAFDAGDLETAVVEARKSAVYYAPGAPHLEPAYARLVAVARGAEAAGDLSTAELAWRAVRGAALETRHVWIPQKSELSRANENLSRLVAMRRAGSTLRDPGELRKQALGALEEERSARAPGVVMLALGLSGIAAGLALLIWRGVLPGGGFRPRPALIGLLVVMIGFACWASALIRA